MAKRARGSTARPGQRAPLRRKAPAGGTPVTAAPATAAKSATARDDIDLTENALDAYEGSSLTDADLARAAQLEAQIVAEEKAAAPAQPTKRARGESFPRATSTLAASAAAEYGYVGRDIKRIVLIGGSLIALLFAGWAVVQATGASLV
jgi:hypothetical protein